MEPLELLPDGYKLTVGSHNVTILNYLSAGGFAHIYKVQIDPLEDNSEIACLKRVLVPDKRGLDQLRKEVDVMKKLRLCRNVVRYYDSHAERMDNGTYQVLVLMELCPNKSLLDYMNAKIKTKLTEPEILTIMLDIGIGVFEMHRKRMIHRDIKIENVLIDGNNRFKLCDFGSTSPPLLPPKNQQEFQALSHDLMYQTTPQYRAPEMIDLYRNLAIDEKADIWALGCFLYKLCYYTTPFEANGDIAILHASFQFPPSPVYSGDLKNLIIILLQENPYFRPNIVQVLKLVCKMMNIDFSTIGVDDIYKLGSYNFQALYQYQQQKQQEIMNQSYYQQPPPNTQSQHDSIPPEDAVKEPKTPISGQSTKSVAASIPAASIPAASIPAASIPAASIPAAQPAADSDSDIDESFGDLDDLDNVEERYPSLENIVPEPDSKSSHSGNTAATAATSNTTVTQPPIASQKNPASYPQIPYPVQPPILSPGKLKELSPEQLQQYNYQHQVFQYQMNQWHFYQQQQQQQQILQQRQNSSMQRSGSQYEKKEAWEGQETKMDEQAEKLADDIFGSKSRSPDGLQVQQKTSQSVKSVKSESAVYNPPEVDDENDDLDTQRRLTKSNNSSLININEEKEKVDKTESTNMPVALELLDGDFGRDPADESEEKNETEPVKEPVKESDVPSTNPNTTSVPMNTPMKNSMNVNIPVSVNAPVGAPVAKSIPGHTQAPINIHAPLGSQMASQPPQVPIPVQNSPEINLYTSPILQSNASFKNNNPFPVNEELEKPEKKSSNPWGEYRTDASKRLSSLNIDEEQKTRKPSAEEINLIDMEIGLKSSSSSSLKLNEESLQSLIDLDFDDKPKPHFKKKSIPNPSDFKVTEEVIDWASDDENPDNNSKMSRLSIRNSLRKLSRKSGEHKRSESSSGKRLSRLMN